LTAHILPTFGERYIEDITWEDIQEWLNALADYARRSVEVYLVTLSMILKKAKEEKLIETNPAESSNLSLKQREERNGTRSRLNSKPPSSEIWTSLIRRNSA